MKLRVVYDSDRYSTGGHAYALDEDGTWWERRYPRARWTPVKTIYKHKPLRRSRMGAPWFGDHRGPWVGAA